MTKNNLTEISILSQLQLDKKQMIASFDVDAQKTFTPLCPDELPVPEGHLIVDELNHQAQFATYRLGSKDAHHLGALWMTNEREEMLSPISGLNMDVKWVPHAVPGTKGFELLDGLPLITDYDFFVWKGVELDMHPYGACYHDFAEKLSTGVIEFLHARQVNIVLVGGLATDYCVKTTVLQLLRANLNVVVNLGACRGLDLETIKLALQTMYSAGAQFIHSADNIVMI